MNKILNKKIHWFFSFIILLVCFLYSGYLIGVKAMGSKVYAGRVIMMIPMAVCMPSNYSCAAACNKCGCGSWDELTMSNEFGTHTNIAFYACKMPSFMPWGSGGMMVGSIAFGIAPSEKLSANDGQSTNIASEFQ